MSDETTPQYRSYSWEDDQGGFYLVLYPGVEEADEVRKARFRAMGAQEAAIMLAEMAAERTSLEPLRPGRPALRLVRDPDPSAS
ncbi:hypothetical protein [Streptomyces sp. FH025]|uniref:hypothetical protein n=1 Tax=Streptomyces sp. FH025 TaxID=2815937 RepID=UPI001A9E681B|nr:hypothetical protein [Streptomyces sp. FH025]MBO1420406.1 hypothetical protein [Streptomyces sp. FH025]